MILLYYVLLILFFCHHTHVALQGASLRVFLHHQLPNTCTCAKEITDLSTGLVHDQLHTEHATVPLLTELSTRQM